MTIRTLSFGLFLAGFSACGTARPPAHGADDAGYLYDDLGSHQRLIATRSEAAQRYFDQGLTLAFAFNHDEAIRSFREAARLDPECAMAWWGIALAHGPHINFPVMPPERVAAAWEAIQRARSLVDRARPAEHALIDALARRYVPDPAADRGPLDLAYAEALRGAWRAHPLDADVGTLFAEALMDLHPWDLWTLDGRPKPYTPEIVETLERVLQIAPDHPGANHLFVHAVEASSTPGRADAAADRLRTLVPGSSHLVHMPSHIDVRRGRFAAASDANERAIEVDRRYAERTGRAGFYRVYMAHNVQFLSFSAMMEGRSAVAIDAARAMVAGFPPELLETLGPFVDGILPIVFHALVRFGRWEEILAEPRFPDLFGAANAVRHYARGVALTALGRLAEADREQEELDALVAAMDERPIGNNPARLVLRIPQKLLRGEYEFRRGRRAVGLALLREAAAIEDTLVYDEPPDWMMPVRHTLGAALVEAREFAEAERVYREDLRRFPANGWSTFGLARALAGLGREAEAEAARAEFSRAFERADVTLRSSCFCQPGS